MGGPASGSSASRFQRAGQRFRRFTEIMAVIFMAAMFGAFLLQVFMRYVVNRPLNWTSEVSVIFYIWVVFWGAAFVVRPREHVAFTMLFDAAPPKARRLFAVVFFLVIGAAFVAAMPGIVDYVTFMKIDSTPVTRIRFDYTYSIFVVFAVSLILRCVWAVARLLGPGWQKALDARNHLRRAGEPPDEIP